MDTYRRVSSDQLKERLRRGEPGLLVDLREKAAFKREHIAGSINLPLEGLKPGEFLKDHADRPVYLICSCGKRAYQAAALFYESGFFDVIVIAGGLLSWRVLGFPLVGTNH